ncbi:hypothetical protein CR162_19005 [Pseudoroseomonas rhizosphaerae]|uniref:Uncharacterized protein n=2 Tax=Teichococcus rhizosphaerae TaxID=1335062 RepID=A0A2C6XXT0_9PROT|nr:hypothetical protein CR162_19005 [Pseudoroseomonas rhizosphaerae]
MPASSSAFPLGAFPLGAVLLGAAVAATVAAGLLIGPPAQAQDQYQRLRGPMTPDAQAQPRRAEPPALPGLAGRRSPAPIPAEAGQNLGPNEALFDAINRGDLAAARDAMARGADLGARNMLGLTPIDSAVDQGRSEIAFFLLSSRGPAPAMAPAPAAASSTPPGLSGGPAPRPAPAPRVAAAPAPRPAPAAPRLWSEDGGAPRPDRGFLGFDAGRPGG